MFIPQLLIIAVSIPLILNKVPPNNFYGFRTPKTKSSPQVWYPANRQSGIYLASAAAISIGVNLILNAALRDRPDFAKFAVMMSCNAVALAIAVILSFAYLRRL